MLAVAELNLHHDACHSCTKDIKYENAIHDVPSFSDLAVVVLALGLKTAMKVIDDNTLTFRCRRIDILLQQFLRADCSPEDGDSLQQLTLPHHRAVRQRMRIDVINRDSEVVACPEISPALDCLRNRVNEPRPIEVECRLTMAVTVCAILVDALTSHLTPGHDDDVVPLRIVLQWVKPDLSSMRVLVAAFRLQFHRAAADVDSPIRLGDDCARAAIKLACDKHLFTEGKLFIRQVLPVQLIRLRQAERQASMQGRVVRRGGRVVMDDAKRSL